MRLKYITFLSALSLIVVVMLFACKSSKKSNVRADVTVHIMSDPEMLNPVCYTDAGAAYIMRYMYQSMIDIDFKTLELTPVLAESMPVIEKEADGKMKFTYRIRPEAKWDNGSPITAKDVEFTLKVIKNPKVNNAHARPYYEHLIDFIYDTTDPLKFTVVYDVTYILAESSSGDYLVLPEYFYDPNGLMKNFTVKQLNEEKDKLASDAKINEFANDFNSEKRMREKDQIGGSGPYKLDEWITGQRVVLKKKENWWGDKLKGTNMFFEANAPKINYKTINDMTSALVALKAGDLDLMHGIKPKDFFELSQSEKFKASYNAYTPTTLAYAYIGINSKRPKFSDRRTREAIAHLLDINKMIQTVYYGYAQPTIGPIHPSKTKMYNNNIKPYEYDLEKAKQLLAEAGWKDTNGDGTLDKMIDGKRTEFIVDYIYNAGNDTRKQTGLLIQEDARKVGITINVLQQEWAIFLENQKKHNFDISYGAWITAPVLSDLKQVYHSESALNGGSNYTSFGTPESDAIIDSIRIELNEEKRNRMYKRFQQISHDEAVNLFMYAPTERIAISKRFSNADVSIMRPGFYEAAFTVNEEAGK
jgi:ABC-type transport system substrate-binding protein